MGARAQYFTKKHILPVLGWLGGFFAWAEFFAKPFVRRASEPNIGWGNAFSDLLKLVPEAFGWPFSGYVFLLTSALAAFVGTVFVLRPLRYALNYLDDAESPISIIHSEYTLKFNEDASAVECSRVQYIHANRPDVNAYHYKIQPYEGAIDVREIRSDLNGSMITKALVDNSREPMKEFIEEFRDPLPLSFFITYFPDKWVYWSHVNWGWFKRTVVKRTISTVDIDEYNKGKPAFEVEARYPVSGLTIMLKFPDGHGPKDDDVRAYFADDGALRNLELQSGFEEDHRVHKIEFGQLLAGQKLRIMWPVSAPDQSGVA